MVMWARSILFHGAIGSSSWMWNVGSIQWQGLLSCCGEEMWQRLGLTWALSFWLVIEKVADQCSRKSTWRKSCHSWKVLYQLVNRLFACLGFFCGVSLGVVSYRHGLVTDRSCNWKLFFIFCQKVCLHGTWYRDTELAFTWKPVVMGIVDRVADG